MPYLKHDDKERMLDHMYPETPGELNFLITVLCIRYWMKSKENYQAINDIIGACEGAKLEFYRRHAAEYENQKIRENGDVYNGIFD